MHYTQLFRSLREAKGLTYEQVARLTRRHRNTVINVESGRPVKFDTIAELMLKMGYAKGSAEMKSVALLWLEAVSGIPFSQTVTEASARKAIATYGSTSRQAAKRLHETITRADLTADQIDLLVYAAQRIPMLNIIENIRELGQSDANEGPQLKVAEDK